MWRRLLSFATVLAVATTLTIGEASAQQQVEGPPPLDRTTVVLQSIGGTGVGTVLAGSSLGALADLDGGGSNPGGVVVALLGAGGLAATSLVAVPLTVNLTGRLTGGDGYFVTYLGGMAGGFLGALTALGLDQLIPYDAIGDTTGRSMLQVLPYAMTSTAGALVGYHSSRGRDLQQSDSSASNFPVVTPALGAPYTADDDGLTIGARLRY